MDHHLFAAVRPISRFHTKFRGSRDTDEQYLRRRGSDQHSGDHRNGSKKIRQMRSKIILWIRIPMLIPTTCLFVLSLTIVPPFQLPYRGCLLPDSSLLLHIPLSFMGTVFFAVPSAVTAIFWDGQHRLRFRNGSPTALPALSFPCLRLLSLCL